MLQSFECPNCQANLDYDAQTQAITVRCPYCNSTVIVPDSLRSQLGRRVQQPEVLAQVVQLVQNGRKIEAIKLFRETFNVGLKESKDVVDAIERHEDIHLGGTNFHTGTVSVSTFTGTPTVQTSSGRGGCVAFIVLLVVGIIGAGLFLLVFPSDRTTSSSQIIQEVSNAIESSSETVSEIAEEVAPVEPQFAEIILQFGGEEGIGPGFFNDTRRLAIDGEGNIYAGDYSGGRIQVFAADGKFLVTWNAGADLYMSGMTVDHSGTVYIVNNNSIEKYNGMTGEFLGTLTLAGSDRTYFKTIATGPDGSVYFVAKDRLVRLDNNGNIVLDLDEPFANIPNFATTQDDVAIDGAGNIYVLGRETVYKLNAEGQFVDQIGSKGEGEDQFFSTPTSLAVDGKGRIFVDDFYGIKVFEGNGRYLATIDSPGVAFDMLVTNENDLLVMDRNGNEIRKYRLNE